MAFSGYSYNGTVLPKLPEWDREAYPYAFIGYSVSMGTCSLSLSVGTWSANADGNVVASVSHRYGLSDDGTTWVKGGGVGGLHTPIWTNTDIPNEDGTVYLTATIPLPAKLFVQNNESWKYTESGDFNTLPLPNTIDLTVYKYLYLIGNVGAQSHLYATDKPLYYKQGTSAFVAGYLGAKEPVNYKYYSYNGSFDVGGTELWLGDWNEPTLTEVSSPNSDGYYVVKSVYPSAQNTIKWSNATIYKIDGTVLLEPFEPAPNRSEATPGLDGWKYSFKLGLALGLCSKPLPIARKLIGYSYNGTVLPKLPEWDKTVYPYAAIYTYHGNSEAQNPVYRVVMSDTPFEIGVYTILTSGSKYDGLKWQSNYIAQWKTQTMDDWGTDGSGTNGMIFPLNSANDAVVWASHDVLYASDYSIDASLADTLYMAASEPVPVYE